MVDFGGEGVDKYQNEFKFVDVVQWLISGGGGGFWNYQLLVHFSAISALSISQVSAYSYNLK